MRQWIVSFRKLAKLATKIDAKFARDTADPTHLLSDTEGVIADIVEGINDHVEDLDAAIDNLIDEMEYQQRGDPGDPWPDDILELLAQMKVETERK